jgi:uncharacterized protein (DUF4415 family)
VDKHRGAEPCYYVASKACESKRALLAVPGFSELDETFFEKAVRNPFYRPVKKQVTVRLDADVIAWLRAQGSGYQTKINSMLRNTMLKALGKGTA